MIKNSAIFLERVAGPGWLRIVAGEAAWERHWAAAALAVLGATLVLAVSLVVRKRVAAERVAERSAAVVAGSRVRAAEQAAADLERLFQSIEEPLVATDTGGAVVLWNRAAEGLLGVPASRAIGRP